MADPYSFFRNKIDVRKFVDIFFEMHKNDIIRSWLERYAFCITKDYNTASCDEYDVASEMAREIVQPLYDDAERIEAEIKKRLLEIFLTYRPMCSNCRYFRSGREAEALAGRPLARDEGYCMLKKTIVCNDDICEHYTPS